MRPLADYVLGPLADLRRFLRGFGSEPPSRTKDPVDLIAARGAVTSAGCDPTHCTEENLHRAVVALPAAEVYDLFNAWQAWPRSGFFPTARRGRDGIDHFSYRFYGVLPVVTMHCVSAVPSRHIIHGVTWGFGHGGYHCFLFRPISPNKTEAAIYTTYPRQFFLTGLHDEMNRDIYRKLAAT